MNPAADHALRVIIEERVRVLNLAHQWTQTYIERHPMFTPEFRLLDAEYQAELRLLQGFLDRAEALVPEQGDELTAAKAEADRDYRGTPVSPASESELAGMAGR